jgi:hypothetical protein
VSELPEEDISNVVHAGVSEQAGGRRSSAGYLNFYRNLLFVRSQEKIHIHKVQANQHDVCYVPIGIQAKDHLFWKINKINNT